MYLALPLDVRAFERAAINTTAQSALVVVMTTFLD